MPFLKRSEHKFSHYLNLACVILCGKQNASSTNLDASTRRARFLTRLKYAGFRNDAVNEVEAGKFLRREFEDRPALSAGAIGAAGGGCAIEVSGRIGDEPCSRVLTVWRSGKTV